MEELQDVAVPPAAAQRKRKPKKPVADADAGKFVEMAVQTNVYVTGLPEDVTLEEIETHFNKCGIIKRDPETGKLAFQSVVVLSLMNLGTAAIKIKVYRHPDGRIKGDGLVSYLRPESVDLAVSILDESYLRPTCKLHVEKVRRDLLPFLC
jgi:HIV Tat-specific factor 1